MNIKYYQENKVTKKNDTKEPLQVTREGFVDEDGEVKTYWDFFKDFEDTYINISVSHSTKFDLEESESEEEEGNE